MFKLANTFSDPAEGSNAQRGMPAPGEGEQLTGVPISQSDHPVPRYPERPIKGFRSWFRPADGSNAQRGMPSPEDQSQARPLGSMPNNPVAYGLPIYTETPYYDRGAAAFVPNFGYVLYNPIGAGRAVDARPQASYGPAGQYINDMIFWTSQAIPTSINLQGLTNPDELLEVLGELDVYGAVRVGK